MIPFDSNKSLRLLQMEVVSFGGLVLLDGIETFHLYHFGAAHLQVAL